MLGVVVLHYNNGGIGGGFQFVKEGSVNQYYLFATENLFICAVDLFVMISAYYLSATNERHLIKIIELFVQVVVFRCSFYIAGIMLFDYQYSTEQLLERLLPCNYFVILYSALYVISPYINKLIDNLNKKQLRDCLVILLLIFSVWSMSVDVLENIKGTTILGLSSIGMYGSQDGYTIVNFILLYFVGAYIRTNNFCIKKKTIIRYLIIILMVMYAVSLLEHKLHLPMITAWNYNNPLIIAVAALLVSLFTRIQFNSKTINELAKGAFTCYLFHESFMDKLYIKSVVNESLIVLILHQLGVVIGLYLVSYLVYKVYYFCSNRFIKLIFRLCKKK